MPKILIDTNILVLQIVGTWDRDAVPLHRRTRIFTVRDFDLLQHELRRCPRVVTTPGVLAEASNLMGNDFHETVAGSFVAVCAPLVEVRREKEAVFGEEAFPRLGFADASVLLALDDETVLLTDDVQLYNQALYQGREALNFSHLRKFDSA